MKQNARPLIGLTLDAERPGGYSAYPWYALRTNYAEAITAAGGLPLALPHQAALAENYLDTLDALVVTGGAFDVSPALYGDEAPHASVKLKPSRTESEMVPGAGGAGAQHAGARHLRRAAAAGGSFRG